MLQCPPRKALFACKVQKPLPDRSRRVVAAVNHSRSSLPDRAASVSRHRSPWPPVRSRRALLFALLAHYGGTLWQRTGRQTFGFETMLRAADCSIRRTCIASVSCSSSCPTFSKFCKLISIRLYKQDWLAQYTSRETILTSR